MKRRPSLPTPHARIAVFIAACIFSLLIHPGSPTGDEFIAFAVLSALVLVTPLVTSSAGDDRAIGLDSTAMFLFAGAILLPPILLVLLALLYLSGGWRGVVRLSSLDQSGDLSMNLSAGARLATVLVISTLISYFRPSEPWQWAASLIFCGLLFLAADLSYELLISRIPSRTDARFVNPRQGLARSSLIVLLGAVLAMVWRANPWLVIPALLQLLLIYRVSQIPRLERQAQTDAKTGLWNARHLDILFKTEIERATRFNRPLSVLMADLDLMRNINNRYGHLVGDAVLVGIGEIIRKSLREYDIAARFGGEEFVIVLPETGPDDARVIAERIRAAVGAEPFGKATVQGSIHATLSIGVASFPADAIAGPDLMRAADRALYSAKARGRDRVAIASQSREALVSPQESIIEDTTFTPLPSVAIMSVITSHLALLRRFSRGALIPSPNIAWLSILLLCGLVSGSTLIVAAQQALPGDPLYSVKRAGESMRLEFAIDDGARAALELEIGRNRFGELTALIENSRYSEVGPAVLEYVRQLERVDKTLGLLQMYDPALAEFLAQRALLQWTEASALLSNWSGHVPSRLESPIAQALAAVSAETVKLKSDIAGINGARVAPQAEALPTPEPAQSPAASPAPVPQSAARSAISVADFLGDIPAATATPSASLFASHAVLLVNQMDLAGGPPVVLMSFKERRASNGLNGLASTPSTTVRTAAPPKPTVVEPAPHKTPTPPPACPGKHKCKKSKAPSAGAEFDITGAADWKSRFPAAQAIK